MRGVARLGDETRGNCILHGPNISGVIITSSPDVIVNDRGVARLSDTVRADCKCESFIITACSTVFANDLGIARIGDEVRGPTYHATIVTCSANTTADDIIMVGGVTLPANQNSAENAGKIIRLIGPSAIDDDYETNDGLDVYPPLPQTSPPPPINDATTAENNERPADVVSPVTDCSAITIPIDYNFQMTEHFTLAKLSIKAVFPHAIKPQNGLTVQQIACNLKALADQVLEVIWEKYPNFNVNSAFRTRQNGKSQHEKGQAADLQWPGISYDEYWERINWIKDNVNYDQLLFEHGNSPWIHVSFNQNGNRPKNAANAVMTMYNNKFSPGLKKMR